MQRFRLTAAAIFVAAFSVLAALVQAGGPSYAAPAEAQPVRHALLVGVEEYNALPGVGLFDGPRNSVILWHDYLKKQGFTDIAVLAEGMKADDVKWGKNDPAVLPPTRANIQKAFATLEAKLAKSGGRDEVLIVLAGHGSQQRAMPGDPPKPGNLDEVFLPMDAGPRPANDPEGPFTNALVDHDIAPHLKTMAKSASFLWLIFDSCHSDTMTYDALLLKPKPVTSAHMADLGYTAHAPEPSLLKPDPPPTPAVGPSPRDMDWPKNYVAFFASASDRTTPLIILDAGDIANRIGAGPSRFTAFSYFIVDALKKHPDTKFEDIIAHVQANYKTSFPFEDYAPKFEGGVRLKLPASTVVGQKVAR